MIDNSLYLVSSGIAVRSGLIKSRYRTADGRFILDNKDLSRVRFTTNEYISGLKGVEKISLQRAKELIKKNGYKMGPAPSSEATTSYDYVPETTETPTTTTVETTENDDIDSLTEALQNDETTSETETESEATEGAQTETRTEGTSETFTTETESESESETESDATEETTNG